MSGVAGCNKILEQMPTNGISGLSMWQTESQADQGVIGVYDALKAPVQGGGIVGESVNIGYYGFDTFGSTGQGRLNMSSMFLSNVNPGNSRFSYTWQWFFRGIHRANAAITYLPDIPMNDGKRARLIAESKVLRAFFYSRFNQLFGRGIGVPIYTEPASPDELTKGQSSEAEVWAQVIQDLTDAINEPNLPDNQIGGEGRMSKGAAYAMRGNAYMCQKEWEKAAADFAKVEACGYRLFTGAGDQSYKQLFKVANERCEEMIMSVQYIEDPAGYGLALQKYVAAWQQGAQDSPTCWTDLQVSPYAVDLYEVVVDDNTVKPFVWTEFVPEMANVTDPIQRKVFFIRDTHISGISRATGQPVTNMEILDDATTRVNSELGKLAEATRALYLSEGNEARIKAAYANRDPRLAFNVVTPYANFLGGDSSTGTNEGWYTLRWPSRKARFNEATAEPNANPDLPADYYTTGVGDAERNFYYIHRKFVGEGREFKLRVNNPIDEPIIRYADVLLQWAEALVEQNKLSEAMALVKQVRDRAGVPTMASSFSDQTTARNYVRDERRREFVGEGVNFFDEMRWKTLHESKYGQKYAQLVWGEKLPTGTNYEWPGDHFYTWPVPRGEQQMNTNLTKTPGWEY